MANDRMTDSGYNAEEDHFKRQELEWVQKRRAELDAQRKTQVASAGRPANWLKCPKCGGDMHEQKMDVVMIDRCTNCGGVFFDAGELEMLTQHQTGGTMSAFKRLFGGK